MGAVRQILLVTGLLTFSALVHVGAIALSIAHFSKVAGLFRVRWWPRLRVVALLSFSIFVLVLAHNCRFGHGHCSFRGSPIYLTL